MNERYNFSSDFQDMILACLIRHPNEFWAFGDIIRPEFFTGSAAQSIVYRLNEYRRKYNAYPKFVTLANFAAQHESRNSVDSGNDAYDYVVGLSELDTADRKAVLDMSIKFAQERAIHSAIRKIHAAQTEGNGEKIDPVELMRQAINVGTNLRDDGLSLRHHIERIVRETMRRDYGIHTYGAFEKLWKFGWAPGWLIVLLAPPKRYKTAFAINLALEIIKKQDVDVLYYACEITQELAAMRALENITGWTEDSFFHYPEKGINAAKKAVNRKCWGDIWFKGYPSKSTTISQIKSHAHHVVGTYNLKPKAIVIDYAETVCPDKVAKDVPDWRQQADIYTQGRALGAEFGCCVIMPDRCNRETVGRKVPNMKSFQGAFEKAGIVDAAIGICSTDAEYKQRRVRYFVFLNRHGEAYKHYDGKVDPERMQMTVDGEIEYVPDDEETPKRGGRMRRQMAAGAALTQRDDD